MKLALITGSSRGLGKSVAIHAAKRGLGVIVTYNSSPKEAADVVAQIDRDGGQAVALKLDTTKTDSFDGFVKELMGAVKTKWNTDKIDHVVNNAGFAGYMPIVDTKEADFDNLFNVHVKGPFFLTQKLIPHIATGGSVVNISSGLTRFSFPGSAPYAMAKGAIEVFSRYLAKELGAKGIRANTIAPGAVETDFGNGHLRNSPPEAKKMIIGATALARTAVADDIGPVIASLLSDDNAWVTGQRIEASGGMLV